MNLNGKITGLHGLGLLTKILLNSYLIYLAIFFKLKIPAWFFILLGISYISYTTRLIQLNSYIIKNYANLHGYTSLYVMPNFLESSFGAFINIMAGIYLFSSNR